MVQLRLKDTLILYFARHVLQSNTRYRPSSVSAGIHLSLCSLVRGMQDCRFFVSFHQPIHVQAHVQSLKLVVQACRPSSCLVSFVLRRPEPSGQMIDQPLHTDQSQNTRTTAAIGTSRMVYIGTYYNKPEAMAPGVYLVSPGRVSLHYI